MTNSKALPGRLGDDRAVREGSHRIRPRRLELRTDRRRTGRGLDVQQPRVRRFCRSPAHTISGSERSASSPYTGPADADDVASTRTTNSCFRAFPALSAAFCICITSDGRVRRGGSRRNGNVPYLRVAFAGPDVRRWRVAQAAASPRPFTPSLARTLLT